MSSELSSSCHSAIMAANEFDGKLQVVDNHRISVTLKQSVYDALMMAEQGNSAKEIKNKLESEAYEASIYITVDTLTYLKKGGRITPAGAAIGSVLNMKPVLTIQGGKLDAFAKVRGMKAARRTMVQAMKRDIETRLQKWVANDRLQLFISYSHLSDETIKGWYDEVAEAFPNLTIKSDPLTLSIGCHIGPGAIAIAACKTGDI